MAYKPTPPTMDPRQKEPVLSSSSDIPAYIGKPKPQAPKNRIGYSPGGGMVDPASLRRAPRVTQILPGQGMGPMPVGTKPLPMPTVRGSWEDPNYDRAGGMGGPRDNNAGRLSQIAIANGLMDDRGGMQGMKPGGGMGPGGQDPMWWSYGGAGTGPSYGVPNHARDFNVPNYGAPVQHGPIGAPGGPPPVGTGPGSMGKPQQPGGGMPSREGGASHRRAPQQVNQQAMQQGAQALYNDNTIPHEFKGQLLQAAQSGNAQAFNEMLFNSGIPHETKLRLQQMFGYGSGAGAAPQAATPDQGQNQVQQSYSGGKGSPYYGAF